MCSERHSWFVSSGKLVRIPTEFLHRFSENLMKIPGTVATFITIPITNNWLYVSTI
jgi:hypothetical protein